MPKTITWLGFCLALSLTAPIVMAEDDARRSLGGRLSGRWHIVIDMPRGSYETPVEFVVGQTGAVTTTVLGPLGTFRIDSTSGRLDGNTLTLVAETSMGKLKINATLEGDRLRGEWFRDGVARLLFNGEIRGLRDHAHVPKPNLQVFDSVLSHIDSAFYRPDFNGVKLKALRERYRPRVAAARNEGEFLSLMRLMLREFRTSHLDFFATPTWSKELHPPVAAKVADGDKGITWRELAPSVGYLRIESFEDGPQVVARVDRAFAELSHHASLVIDLRGNGGGALSAAMRLGDYLLPKSQPVGYFVSRAGLIRHRARSIDQINSATLPVFSGYYSEDLAREMKSNGALMLATGGRTERAYRGRAVVLIDETCFSASEAFASIVKETGAATLIGRRTNGAMLSAIGLPVEGGWTLWLPVWDFRTPRGAEVEGRGVEPDIAVTSRLGQDADIAAALKFLEKGF